MSQSAITIKKHPAMIDIRADYGSWQDIESGIESCYKLARDTQQLNEGKAVVFHLGKLASIILEEDTAMQQSPITVIHDGAW